MEHDAQVHSLYESSTKSWQFLIADPVTKHSIVIDAVLDAAGSKISTNAADRLLDTARRNNYIIDRLLETHGGSPQRSAAWYLRTQIQQRTGTPPRVSMGKSFAGMQRMFERKYGIKDIGWQKTLETGFVDGQIFDIGDLRAQALHLPSQMQEEHVGFLIGSNVFIGDPALTVDYNITRMNFEDESTHQLWTSIQRLLSLPRDYRIYSSYGDVHGFGDGKAFATVEQLRSICRSQMGH